MYFFPPKFHQISQILVCVYTSRLQYVCSTSCVSATHRPGICNTTVEAILYLIRYCVYGNLFLL